MIRVVYFLSSHWILFLCRAEINIKPWENLLKEIKQGNEKIKWMEREPYAYWKGNPNVAVRRRDLLKCNVSETQDWNARLFIQVKIPFSFFLNLVSRTREVSSTA